MSYRVIFYRDRSGRCQACDYARTMDARHRGKMKRWFQCLASDGPLIPREYGKHLKAGVWELRVSIEHHQHRFLYAFRRDVILVTNAFLKKTDRVPEPEIDRARASLADWEEQHGL